MLKWYSSIKSEWTLLFQFRPVAERRKVAVYCRDGSFSLKSIIHMKAIKKYYFMAIVFSLGLRAKLLHEARPFILDLERVDVP